MLPGSPERVALLALSRLPQIGARRARRLLECLGTATASLAAPQEAWIAALGPAVGRRTRPADHGEAALHEAEQELRRLGDLGGDLIAWPDADYPQWLAQIPDAPVVLCALGNRRLLSQPAVAIVGSRRSTSYGRRVASRLAAQFAARGILVVSGLARGIDGAAHEGALRADGDTIGVLGCGVDVVYPPEHRALHHQIQQQGLLLAEAPLGSAPEAHGFPRRNRIVSGLALAVVVAEAPHRSGALMTARLAAEQGREVFAIPGEITNPRCAGCLELLRDGAGLVRSADDVLEELAAHLPTSRPHDDGQAASAVAPRPVTGVETAAAPTDPADHGLLGILTRGEHDVEGLARQLGAPVAQVQQALLQLELSGQVVRLPGPRYARAG